MSFCTLSKLSFALNPIVKKLFSIKMSIDSWNVNQKKYRLQEVASNRLEKETLRDDETDFCSPLALTVLEKKIFKDLAMFFGFGLSFTLK
jgi:hypothetical protein